MLLLAFLSVLLMAVATTHATTETASSNAKGRFSIHQEKNPNFKANGPAAYRHVLRKYAAHNPNFKELDSGEVEAINATYDKQYLSPVYIGTPPQKLLLDIDTGSADVWVITNDTDASYIENQTIWDISKSSSAEKIPGATWLIQYGDGSSANGVVYRDNLTVGGVTVDRVPIESAEKISRDMLYKSDMSGLLGLAFNHSNTIYPHQKSYLDSLAPELDSNLFAVDLRYHAPGRYDFGHINESAYTGNISWHQLDTRKTTHFWSIALEGLHVAGTDFWWLYSWPVIVDTGTTLMLMPEDIAEHYYSQVPGAKNDFYNGWMFPCNTTLPDFEFGFMDDMKAVIPGKWINYAEVDEDFGWCYGGLQPSTGISFGILGDMWLKAVYCIFDNENHRVGIAKKNLG